MIEAVIVAVILINIQIIAEMTLNIRIKIDMMINIQKVALFIGMIDTKTIIIKVKKLGKTFKKNKYFKSLNN